METYKCYQINNEVLNRDKNIMLHESSIGDGNGGVANGCKRKLVVDRQPIDTSNKGGWVMEDMEIDHAVNPTVQDHRLT